VKTDLDDIHTQRKRNETDNTYLFDKEKRPHSSHSSPSPTIHHFSDFFFCLHSILQNIFEIFVHRVRQHTTQTRRPHQNHQDKTRSKIRTILVRDSSQAPLVSQREHDVLGALGLAGVLLDKRIRAVHELKVGVHTVGDVREDGLVVVVVLLAVYISCSLAGRDGLGDSGGRVRGRVAGVDAVVDQEVEDISLLAEVHGSLEVRVLISEGTVGLGTGTVLVPLVFPEGGGSRSIQDIRPVGLKLTHQIGHLACIEGIIVVTEGRVRVVIAVRPQSVKDKIVHAVGHSTRPRHSDARSTRPAVNQQKVVPVVTLGSRVASRDGDDENTEDSNGNSSTHDLK
jgi:hypothetical protein